MKYLTICFIICTWGCSQSEKTPPLLEDSVELPSHPAKKELEWVRPETLFTDVNTLWIEPCDSIVVDSFYIERSRPFKVEMEWR